MFELNIEKNIFTKIYSCNYTPNVLAIKEIKKFFSFDFESNEFKVVNNVKNLFSDIHAFNIPSNYNYKKFSKI